jgi:hypothetical protein
MSIIGKWINAFITLGAIATFAVADVTIEGRALAQGATLIPLVRIRIPARNATLRRSEAVVQDAIRYKRATAKAAPPESKATFEVLTGKLKIDASRTLGGVKITGGEINLYKKAAWLTPAASMAVCFFVKTDLKPCIEALIPSAVSKDGKNDKIEALPLRGPRDLTLVSLERWIDRPTSVPALSATIAWSKVRLPPPQSERAVARPGLGCGLR